MKIFAALLVLCVGVSAGAAEEVAGKNEKDIGEKITEGAQKASNAMIDAYRSSSEAAYDSRKNNGATVLLSYSALELVLPSKMGATVAWHKDADTLYELDYSYSSVSASAHHFDLASMKETRISLLKRNFGGGAFHWFWGVNYNAFRATINESFMNTAINGASDVFNVQTLGLTLGVGHRWVFYDRFSFGIDWFSWAQPLVILKKEAPFVDNSTNQENKDDIDTALKIVGYFPRWAAFKIYLGYSF
ncbi:hypothetical protein AZI86_06215 [Bdellovibrio bacteriovorus]|uniref:Outer membrane protein n=1 Tax=Bdellovibrio bacteriovorus TaxID=959 RepID=A0A150WQQ4_BDEBC|nr:hypothetical protein [Bdellovibrio bacteriovorus]KYG66637.1 hypothetical protein AZI86_06215 [Bdellovibrio bacteriovorus]